MPPHPSVRSGRSYARQAVKLTARLTSAGGASLPAEVRDLSAAGMFLRPVSDLAEPLVAGSWVRIQLQLQAGREVTLSGEVRWVGNSRVHGCFGVGVEFDELREDLAHR